ncbi:MAG: Flp pilus assembly protein CpaB [Chloroflexi bacterium]|nr:Flp pilus assembly protein CpaB [Chloroflexota bacterium]
METSRRRGISFLVIAGVLALLTGLIVVAYLNDIEKQVKERVNVVVVKRAIPARTLLRADLLELKPIPKSLLSSNYILDPADVLRDTVALVDLQPGDILQRSFLDRNAGLKPGMRAVSVGVNRISGVGGTVRAGNRVDVIVSYQEAGFGTQAQKTELLFQDVEVLGVSVLSPKSSQSSSTTAVAPTGSSSTAQQQLPVEDIPPARFSATGDLMSDSTVTLALTADQALKLTWMGNFGKEIRLMIRRLDEKEVPPSAPVTIGSFQ